jgi:hypothetical protein
MTDRFETVATEHADRVIGGADHGRDVRVLMRSPKAIAFVSRGVNVMTRGDVGQARRIARKATRAALDAPEARIVVTSVFGEGADEAMIAAIAGRNRGTVLVDGGGAPAKTPQHVAAAQVRARHAAATPTVRGLLAVRQTCRQCGAPLRPDTRQHFLADAPKEGHPRSLEDCQRLTNEPVHGVIGHGAEKPEGWWPYVAWFETWDGESLVDPLFCGTPCAATYGRRAALHLPPLEVGGGTRAREAGPESVHHYEREVRITPGGLRY